MKQILIVDDDPANIGVLTDILKPDYEIFFARSGANALARVADGLVPDMILLDVKMPEMDGYEVCRRLKQKPETADIPVIFITALDAAENETLGLQLGAADYITRPFNPEIVRARVHNHLALAEARKESESRYRALFTNTADGVLICGFDGRIHEANAVMTSQTGYGGKDLLEMTFADTCGPAEAGQVHQLFTRIRKTGYSTFVTAQIGKDGSSRPVEVNAHRIEFNGRPSVLIFCRDITQRRAAEAELQRYRDHLEELVALRTQELREKEQTLAELQNNLKNRRGIRNIVGESRVVQQLTGRIEALADVGATVIITGETGTGKELAAEALHYAGIRGRQPYVKIGCSDLSETLLESELFGHARGAFTGAVKDRTGKFEAVGSGTVFLDEIGDIPQTFQKRLTRVLEDRCFERVGENTPIPMHGRIVAATHQDLAELVRQGRFREDLYYRLKVVELKLPPLRERKEDIPLLVRHFLAHFNHELKKSIADVVPEMLDRFMEQDWPGNVRQLKHVLECACVNCSGTVITVDDIPEEAMSVVTVTCPENAANHPEARRILEALQNARWNKTRAARLLGISRQTLYRKIRDLEIKDDCNGCDSL